MAASEIDRIKSKLFALNMRFAEVNSEVAAAQARVFHLEKQLEDARLAALLGEDAGSPSEIGPALESSRDELANGKRLLARIQHSQWETRIRYLLARRRQMQAAQEAARGEREGENEAS